MSNIVSGIQENLIDSMRNPFYDPLPQSQFQEKKLPFDKHEEAFLFRLIDFGMAKKKDELLSLKAHNLARVNSAIPVWSIFLFRVNLTKYFKELTEELAYVNKELGTRKKKTSEFWENIKKQRKLQDSIEHITSLLRLKAYIDPSSLDDDEGVIADQYLRRHAIHFFDIVIDNVKSPLGIFYRTKYFSSITNGEDMKKAFISLFLNNKKYIQTGMGVNNNYHNKFNETVIDRIDVYSLGILLCSYSNLIYTRLSDETKSIEIKSTEWTIPVLKEEEILKFKFIADSIQQFLLVNNILAFDPMVIPNSNEIYELYVAFVANLKQKIDARDYRL